MSAVPAAIGSVESEHGKLRRELGRFDTIFFLMSAMVVVDTIGAVAIGGGEAFTWLVVLFVTFFVPSALITAELGAAVPGEGGAYVWVRMAFGRFAGALTSMLYWAGTPMWLGGSVAVVAMTVYRQFVADLSRPAMYGFGIVFVGAATLVSVLPLRFGKWVPTSGAIGQIVLLTVFTVSVILYGVRHGLHGIAAGDLAPSKAVLIAVVPVLLYSFVGVELPSTAGEEMRDPRHDIPVAIARAGIGQALMYGIPTLAVLVVLPAERISSLHGLIDAMRSVFTVYGGTGATDGTPTLTGLGLVVGWACAALFVWVLIASGAAWIMGAGRAQAAACLDGAGPAWFGVISERTGVPVRMGLVSGAVSMVAMLANLTVRAGNGEQYFTAALTSAISLIVLAYLLIYPSFLVLRRRADIARPFRAPGGRAGAVGITTLATGWSLVAATYLLWPGFGTAHPDRALPVAFRGERLRFELLVLAPVVAVVASCAVLFLLAGRPGEAHARRVERPRPSARTVRSVGGRPTRSPRRGS